jgi:hypothetical protein
MVFDTAIGNVQSIPIQNILGQSADPLITDKGEAEEPVSNYQKWLQLVKQLIANSLDATNYEVQTMKLLGPNSFELFGIDDLILQTRRQASLVDVKITLQAQSCGATGIHPSHPPKIFPLLPVFTYSRTRSVARIGL